MNDAPLIADLLAPTSSLPVASIAALRAATRASRHDDSAARAAVLGTQALTLGWAFAGGYQAALSRALPSLGDATAALCATEEGGAHPRAIRTTLRRAEPGWRLDGRKAWVTLGLDAEQLVVLASVGERDGKNALRAAIVPATRAGVVLSPGPPTPFAPDITHATLTLDGVHVDDAEVSPGDGYDAILKPFRTIEDTHVIAAALGWALGVGARASWPAAWRAEAIACVLTLTRIASAPPSQAETHVALAGAIATARRLLEEAPWATADGTTQATWTRDRPILDVARSARAARLEAALRSLCGGRAQKL